VTQNKHLKEAMIHPEVLYNSPDDVLNDKDLSKDRKLTILENWADEVQQVLDADAENMCPEKNGTHVEKLLQKITDCMRALKIEDGQPPLLSPPFK
jgi:DNA gyrase/topoisomerase IV subunit B